MSVLLTNEILAALVAELQNATDSVQIITAFSKLKTLEYLNGYIADGVAEKKLMVRFRLDDLIKGATDFEVLNYALNNGWKPYIRFDLHAKTYIVDDKRMITSSANATGSGLGLGRNENLEMGSLEEIEEDDLDKIRGIYRDAITVDKELIEKLRVQYEAAKENAVSGTKVNWDTSIMDMFVRKVDCLFSNELPNANHYDVGEYISFLDYQYDGDAETFKELFRRSNLYIWLTNVLRKNENNMFFGGISKELHSVLIADPKPYRKDVKIYLANIFSLIKEFSFEELEIDVPNYSERLILK